MKISFESEGWDDFQHWLRHDKKICEKISELIKDIRCNPFEGIGKPEPLRYEFSGCWSRRITQEHRLIYKIENDTVFIVRCRFHYDS